MRHTANCAHSALTVGATIGIVYEKQPLILRVGEEILVIFPENTRQLLKVTSKENTNLEAADVDANILYSFRLATNSDAELVQSQGWLVRALTVVAVKPAVEPTA